LRAGLGIAPGPLMVPLFAFGVAGRLIARIGAGAVIALGLTSFSAGIAWWALTTMTAPDYAGSVLIGMLLIGIGVGLTLPTLMATAAGSLPPQAFATGSAAVNMIRQIGLAIGVAILIAVLGTPASSEATVSAFHRGWWVTSIIGAAGLVPTALIVGLRRQRVPK
jgi:MFS family permease